MGKKTKYYAMRLHFAVNTRRFCFCDELGNLFWADEFYKICPGKDKCSKGQYNARDAHLYGMNMLSYKISKTDIQHIILYISDETLSNQIMRYYSGGSIPAVVTRLLDKCNCGAVIEARYILPGKNKARCLIQQEAYKPFLQGNVKWFRSPEYV